MFSDLIRARAAEAKEEAVMSAGSGASSLVGGIATNKITTFWWQRKRGTEAEAGNGSGSGTKILKSASLLQKEHVFNFC